MYSVHGSTLTTSVKLERNLTKALMDTGSPVFIVSLQFLLRLLAKNDLTAGALSRKEVWSNIG